MQTGDLYRDTQYGHVYRVADPNYHPTAVTMTNYMLKGGTLVPRSQRVNVVVPRDLIGTRYVKA